MKITRLKTGSILIEPETQDEIKQLNTIPIEEGAKIDTHGVSIVDQYTYEVMVTLHMPEPIPDPHRQFNPLYDASAVRKMRESTQAHINRETSDAIEFEI